MTLAENLRAARLPAPSVRRAIRLAAGASLRELADDIGVLPMTVLRWERGENEPRRAHAIAYRSVLDELSETPR